VLSGGESEKCQKKKLANVGKVSEGREGIFNAGRAVGKCGKTARVDRKNIARGGS